MSRSFSPAWLAATAKPEQRRRRTGYFLNSGGSSAILAAIRRALFPVRHFIAKRRLAPRANSRVPV